MRPPRQSTSTCRILDPTKGAARHVCIDLGPEDERRATIGTEALSLTPHLEDFVTKKVEGGLYVKPESVLPRCQRWGYGHRMSAVSGPTARIISSCRCLFFGVCSV